MAATVTGAVLTERHRAAQITLRAGALREVLALWPLLDPQRLDATAPAWLALMRALIARWRAQSSAAAASYYRAFRVAETGQLAGPQLRGRDLDTRRVDTSLAVTGPVRIKQLTGRGETPPDAARAALVAVSGAAGRHVLDGGREVLDELVRADPVALGWARVTDADPCAFCALLASRGPVYTSQASATQTVTGQAYHDACACSAEPLFSRTQPWPGNARAVQALYQQATAGYSGRDAINAFRRAYERRTGA